jgi:hypothetical protein
MPRYRWVATFIAAGDQQRPRPGVAPKRFLVHEIPKGFDKGEANQEGEKSQENRWRGRIVVTIRHGPC